MTVIEFYKTIGGDYDGTVGRFMGEERVLKFLKLFLKDPSISDLKKNMAEENYKEAFRAAHTLKGVAANLGMTAMQQSASEITEALRDGKDIERAKALMPKLDEICDTTISALNTIMEQE